MTAPRGRETHTPGPWTVRVRDEGTGPFEPDMVGTPSARGPQMLHGLVAEVWAASEATDSRESVRERQAANARLIALSPELLAFAERVADGQPHSRTDAVCARIWMDEARALLARVRGEVSNV